MEFCVRIYLDKAVRIPFVQRISKATAILYVAIRTHHVDKCIIHKLTILALYSSFQQEGVKIRRSVIFMRFMLQSRNTKH